MFVYECEPSSILCDHPSCQESTYELLDPNEFFIRPVDFTYLRQAKLSKPQQVHVVQSLSGYSFLALAESP